VTGANIRVLLNVPGVGLLVTGAIAPGATPVLVGFPAAAGTWTLQVENLGGASATCAAEVGFTGPDGFDYFRLTAPLTYLARSQNADGGWGIGPGEDSHLMITAEVLRCLAGTESFVGSSILSAGSSWLLGRQNGDGGFSSEPAASNPGETVLAVNALKAVNPLTALDAALDYLRDAQEHDGSWDQNPYLTAAAIRALSNPPVVSPIPGQTVAEPAAFASIDLDDYVIDPDHADNQLTWTAGGNSVLGVNIVDRVATISYSPGTIVSETLTFTATDPDGLQDSSSATFEVTVLPPVDYTIARGGTASDSRRFSGDPSILDQIQSFTEQTMGVPSGVTYLRTSFGRPTATEIEIGFDISAGPAAALGDHEFQVLYELHDEFPPAGPPLGPLTGNLFNFRIRITP
jgi:hypothetical protein